MKSIQLKLKQNFVIASITPQLSFYKASLELHCPVFNDSKHIYFYIQTDLQEESFKHANFTNNTKMSTTFVWLAATSFYLLLATLAFFTLLCLCNLFTFYSFYIYNIDWGVSSLEMYTVDSSLLATLALINWMYICVQ